MQHRAPGAEDLTVLPALEQRSQRDDKEPHQRHGAEHTVEQGKQRADKRLLPGLERREHDVAEYHHQRLP